MTYTQTRDANWQVPYVGGWCLKYVQDAFGTDHPYPTAIAAWNANYGGGNHPGELPPAGKTVAVYFLLGNVPAGHVAISLDDGSVASSTQPGSHAEGFIHPNLQNLIDVYGKYNGGCSYIGWSEYVGTVQVVKPVIQPTPQGGDDMIDQDTLNKLFNAILGRNPDDGAVSHYVGHFATSFVVSDLLASGEHQQYVQNRQAQLDNLNSQVTQLGSQLQSEQTKSVGLVASVSDLTQQLSNANATIADLGQQIAALQAAADKPEPSQPTDPVAPSQTTPTPDTSTSTQTLIQKIVDVLVSLFGSKKS